jgi:hypothetical protein
MIEGKDILTLCSHVDGSLMPLHRHVLRPRSDGQTFKLTIALAHEMGISDVTVRLIEH